MACAVMAMIGMCARVFSSKPPDRRGGFESIHHGHLGVHQNQVEALLLQCVQRLNAVGRYHHHVALVFEQARGQLLIHHIVFGQQDAQRQPALAQRVARDHLAGLTAPSREASTLQQRVQQVRLEHGLDQVGRDAEFLAAQRHRRVGPRRSA